MIKGIIFDCFGVLTRDLWLDYLSSLDPSIRESIDDLHHSYDKGQITRHELLQALRSKTGRVPDEVEAQPASETIKNDELLSYIADLGEHYQIGLVSNVGSDWIERSFLSKQEAALFEVRVYSYATGLAKPDPEIFKLAADRLQLLPAECCMVDDLAVNVSGAQTAGLQAIRYCGIPDLRESIRHITNDRRISF